MFPNMTLHWAIHTAPELTCRSSSVVHCPHRHTYSATTQMPTGTFYPPHPGSTRVWEGRDAMRQALQETLYQVRVWLALNLTNPQVAAGPRSQMLQRRGLTADPQISSPGLGLLA